MSKRQLRRFKKQIRGTKEDEHPLQHLFKKDKEEEEGEENDPFDGKYDNIKTADDDDLDPPLNDPYAFTKKYHHDGLISLSLSLSLFLTKLRMVLFEFDGFPPKRSTSEKATLIPPPPPGAKGLQTSGLSGFQQSTKLVF